VPRVPAPPTLSAADRRRFAPVIAERVDELEAAVAESASVDALEGVICLAAVRFQSAEAPVGGADMLVGELERRATPQAATVLAGFASLCSVPLAEPAGAALQRLAAAGTPATAPDGLGALRAIEVRRSELLRGQLWTLALQRPNADDVQLATLALERDGDDVLLARGFLTEPLDQPDALTALHPAGDDVEQHAASTPDAAGALRRACAHNRELGFAVPYELAIALPLIARAVGLDADEATGLLVAPEGEQLWTPPEDDDIFGRVAGRVLEDFVDWGTADGRPRIPTIARSGWRIGAAMLDYARHANDGALGRWTPTDLADFFLGWIAGEETFTHEEMTDTADVAQELLTYLAEGGQLTGPDGLDALLAHCHALRPDLEEAWSDRSQRGLAQSLIMQMREEGLDPTDPAALQAFTADFNARPFEQRDAILGPSMDLRPRPAGRAGTSRSKSDKGQRRNAKAARKRNRR
jgi:hypothetical protein